MGFQYILYTPSWFFGLDSIFEFISVFITIFIGYYSYKLYKLVSDKKYFYFSLAFMFIAISFIAKAVIIMLIYLRFLEFDALVDKIDAVRTIKLLGFVVYMTILLTAYMVLLIINMRIKDRKLISLMLLIVVLSVIISSNMYAAFFIVSAILLIYVAHSYYKNYCKCKSKSSLVVLIAFSLIAISQFSFIFYFVNPIFYVIGHVVQLGGYLTLLGNLYLVLKK